MRIAVVNKHPDDTLGGSEIQCDLIADSLTDLGHHVSYIAVGGKQAKYERRYDVRTVARTPGSILSAVLQVQPDIIYWRSCRYQFPEFIKLLLPHDIPLVFAISNRYDIHILESLRVYKNKGRAMLELFRLWKQHRAMRHVNGVTTLNPDFIHRIPNKQKAVVLNAMVDETEGVRFRWPRRYCVWVANLKEWKRPEAYVELARRLEKIDVDFLMVGKLGHDYGWLQEPNRLPSNLHVLGAKTLSEVNGIIDGSLMLIHTGHAEGFGNVFIQAWMKGKPTLSLGFDPGGYIEKEGLGASAKGDFSLFTSCVQRYIASDLEREAAGTRARQFAASHFTPTRLAQDIEGFLSQVIMSRKGGSSASGNNS